MTNKKEVAQKVLDAWGNAPFQIHDLTDVLRELVFELQYYQFCREEGVEDMVLDARDILDVCDELENL
jgi:hypothetical protein